MHSHFMEDRCWEANDNNNNNSNNNNNKEEDKNKVTSRKKKQGHYNTLMLNETTPNKKSYEIFSRTKKSRCHHRSSFSLAWLQELGIDSGGFGRLISKMRQHQSLGQVDLQMLFEHPTVPCGILLAGWMDGWMDGWIGGE